MKPGWRVGLPICTAGCIAARIGRVHREGSTSRRTTDGSVREGHGFARPINNLAMVTAMEKFIAKYLGGRFHEDVSSDVEAKLKEITVDPKTISGAITPNGTPAAPTK